MDVIYTAHHLRTTVKVGFGWKSTGIGSIAPVFRSASGFQEGSADAKA